MTEPIRFAHYSDTHLGREQYHEATTTSGKNQRGVDLVRAFNNVTRDIAARPDVPLALHAGDVCDTPNSPIPYMLAAKNELNRVNQPLDDAGYIRQHVVIAGNHDLPRSPKEPCYLSLFKGAPGLTIVTHGYKVVTFKDEVAEGTAHPSLKDVAVHCVPHDDLATLDWDEVQPLDGYRNIFMSHGVAEGSSLYVHAKGREYPIPADVMSRDWDYVALGHWHKRGPVFLAGDTGATKSRIWYSGSPENCNFSDARDDNGKGYLIVELGDNQRVMPQVEEVTLPIRSMITLPAVDATDLSPEDISKRLEDRVKAADTEGVLAGSVVRQRVTNARQDLWALVDKGPAKKAASSALAYDCRPLFDRSDDDDSGLVGEAPEVNQDTDFEELLTEQAKDLLPDRLREPAVKSAVQHMGRHIALDVDEDEDK